MTTEVIEGTAGPSEPAESATAHRVLALYKFVAPSLDIRALRPLQEELELHCRASHARGCLLIAPEGINGTISYLKPAAEDTLLAYLRATFSGVRCRLSEAPCQVFHRLKIKVKSEIVTLGQPVDTTKVVGTYITPGAEWNALLMDPGAWVIDTRNNYEVRVGTFRSALDPRTRNFREFPDWLQEYAETRARPKKIAMFCTGGIRCEKATSMVIASGMFPDIPVYHLEGGILNYLDTVPREESLFEGECYVFDQRVAVTHGLEPSTQYISCFGCRNPLSRDDQARDDYIEGISCRYCLDSVTDKRHEKLEERQRQVRLAAITGRPHIHDPKERSPRQKQLMY